jgi:SAM-dependent methyltransferase
MIASLKRWIKRRPAVKRFALLSMRLLPTAGPASLIRYPRFIRDLSAFRSGGGEARVIDLHPCLRDRTATTPVDPQYFHQAVWAMRQIHAAAPAQHVDVGSHVLFVGMLSAVVPVTFVDIRPLDVAVEGLTMRAGSIVALPFASGTVGSLSCLHVIEHIGLGRYGDPIDPAGSAAAAAELTRVLAPGGRLYLSTPIGRRRVQFNSQRVFDPADIVMLFKDCALVEFSLLDSAGRLWCDVPPSHPVETESGNDFGLGLFVFERLPS